VFHEALRLYPPAWLITRKAIQPDDLGGVPIPSNALVIISPYTMHRHPDYWQEPEKFDPTRFGAERFNTQHKFAYLPFGGGPALCIGKNFALIEAQIVLAKLSQVFQFDLAEDRAVEMDALVTLRPRGGLPMRLTER
jgi:cytochrome P450